MLCRRYTKSLVSSGLSRSTSAISPRGGHSGDSVVRKMRGLSLGSSPKRFGGEWTDTPSTRKSLRSTNQNAGLSALLAHDRWCFSRSVSALSVRSSFCRARLRIPASLSPNKILGGSDLTAAAAACSNWTQILHGIAFTSFEAYTFLLPEWGCPVNARVVQCLESQVFPHRWPYLLHWVGQWTDAQEP
jgi:hypothetical protein